ncbi:MAG: ABC transporter ATP-binding protein [Anaerolineae bacterium]|nr:ABC transporter ATP-binding protein [Anaerolineae bacterium]MDQ7033719.1 ABC transporter ATP-binding protein [Anaerolineae bacterium]
MTENATLDDIQLSEPDDSALLRLRDISAGYGKITILHGINIDVREGEIVCVIGPNGAGKSTAFKAVYGFVTTSQGKIHFGDSEITNNEPEQVIQHGITFVPQGRSTFPQMTVDENLELGMYLVRDKARIRKAKERIYEMFPRLGERKTQLAGTMSGGEQRMLEIGRALMLQPRMIMLDEPSAGLAPVISKQVFAMVKRMNEDFGITVFMVEQNARQGLEISHRGYVLEAGRNRFEGTGQALMNSQAVQRLYLGAGH